MLQVLDPLHAAQQYGHTPEGGKPTEGTGILKRWRAATLRFIHFAVCEIKTLPSSSSESASQGAAPNEEVTTPLSTGSAM